VLGLLVLDRELSLVPALLRHYVSVRRQAAGMAEAEVATPAPLSPAEETALREAVARLAGMRTLVDFKVSPELLGGVRLRFGTRVFDSTLRTRLAALEQRLSPA
jgi:F-type H+-transporting ATPase subunit delta